MAESRKRRGPGCCGIIVILLLIGVAWLVAMRYNVLERVGLRQPIAERVFAPPPDREAAAQLMGALQAAGVNTEGLGLHVLPMAGQEGSAAILTLDESQGFSRDQFFQGDLSGTGIDTLLEGGFLEEHNVTRIAFDYRDSSGRSVVTLTAPTEVLRRLDEDQITQEEFIRHVQGRIDIPVLLGEVLQ